MSKYTKKPLEVISSLNIDSHSPNTVGKNPKISDIEVTALSLTAEFRSMDSENDLFRKLSNVDIPNLIERSQFNKRRRKLFGFSKAIGMAMASKFTELEDYFIVDGMPLEICKEDFMKLHLKKVSVLYRTAGFIATNFMGHVRFREFFIPSILQKPMCMKFITYRI